MYEAPKEFSDHIDDITALVNRIDDDTLRRELFDAIEMLVHGMNGPWQGARVGWQWGEIPDDLASLFDEGA